MGKSMVSWFPVDFPLNHSIDQNYDHWILSSRGAGRAGLSFAHALPLRQAPGCWRQTLVQREPGELSFGTALLGRRKHGMKSWERSSCWIIGRFIGFSRWITGRFYSVLWFLWIGQRIQAAAGAKGSKMYQRIRWWSIATLFLEVFALLYVWVVFIVIPIWWGYILIGMVGSDLWS